MRVNKRRFVRIASLVLCLFLFLLSAPLPIRAASTFVIPGSDKVYELTGKSTNTKNTARYLAIDENIVYIVFETRKDKYLVSGDVSINLLNQTKEFEMTFPEEHRAYQVLKVLDNEYRPKTASDGEYFWQVGYFTISEITDDANLVINATSSAGGFNIKNIKYTLSVEYGMTVTKVLVTVNDEPITPPVTVNVGDRIAWHINVTNSGDIDLHNITVEDKLPGTTLDYNGTFDLPAGETKTILATYTVQPEDAGCEIINVVAASTEDNLVEGGTSDASKIEYAVIYDPNGGINAPEPQTKPLDTSVNISNGLPTYEGYDFLGWNTAADGSGEWYEAGSEYSKNENLFLYAIWDKLFCVRFHTNIPGINESVFRAYYPQKGTMPQGGYALTEDNKVSSFYDIPTFDYATHNRYIFKGWYLADGTPMNWGTAYMVDTDLYAHWIETDSVAKADDDTKELPSVYNGYYPGYELVGIQFRGVENDTIDHYGEVGTGLRFITVLSQAVYDEINALPGNEGGAEYGFAMAKKDTIPSGTQLLFKSENVNGMDTTETHNFVVNLKCSGVPDHYSNVGTGINDEYRLYTGVVTYKKAATQGEDALKDAYSQYMVARAYIRYFDANGLLRTHHSNYTGFDSLGGGCSACFNMVLPLIQK